METNIVKTHKGLFIALACFFTLFLFATKGYSQTHNITASAGPGGTITPSGDVPVAENDDQPFDINAGLEYEIFDVVVDGSSLGPFSPDTLFYSHTFFNVTADHSIIASFTCVNPVRLETWDGTFLGYYNTIMEAYNNANSDDVIMLQDGIFFSFQEDLFFNRNITVMLEGGYDCSFSDNSMQTKIDGSLTVSAGTVIPSNIVFKTNGAPPCVEGDPNNFPGNIETCDGLDNNCNGIADDGLSTDADGDGHYTFDTCDTFTPRDDCDDSDPNNFPGNVEACDGLDNNCNGQADEGLVPTDADGDGYTSLTSCGGSADDCNDSNPNIHPGAIEIIGDGIDQDCNGKDTLSAFDAYCFHCHYDYNQVDLAHTYITIPEPSCADCHEERAVSIRSHYGQTVMTPGNNVTAGAVIVCATCHDWHDPAHYAYPGANFVWAKVTAATALSCYTCHENLSTEHESAQAHNNRVIDPLCANCHTSDTSVLGQPGNGTLVSDADINALHTFAGDECLHCHAYTGTAPAAAIVDQAILDGFGGAQIACLTCHGVEFSSIHAFIQDHGLLIRVGTTGCGDCHSDPPPLVDAVDPKVHNACSSCHDENYNRISLAAGKTFAAGGDCTTCHTDTWENTHTTAPDHTALVTVGTTGCGDCHSSPPPLVDGADPKVHNGCSSCHNPTTGALISLATGKSFTAGGDCTTCHTDTWENTHTTAPDHTALVTVGTTTCGNCHSNPPPLVDGADPKVHDGCSSCHDSASGALISLAVGKSFDPGGDCTTCHTDTWETMHTTNTPDHTSLVTVGTTSCSSCHSDPPPLTDAGDPKVHNACSSCHDAAGGLISRAAGKSFDPPGGNCTTCHTEPFGSIHSGGTDHSGIITTSGTQCGTCHADPPPLVSPTDPKVHDACSSCHDSQGALVGSAIGASAPGNCNTCHGADFTIIHPDDIDHTAIVTVGSTSCGSCHSDPPPLVDPVDPKVHNECISCHNTDGGLVSYAIGKSFAVGGDCATCHTDPFGTIHPDTVDHSLAIQLSTACAGCHSGPPPVVDPAEPTNHDTCGNCHDTDGALISLASGNTAPNECIDCHGNDLGTLHPSLGTSHVATPGSDYVVLFAAGSHDSAMVGDGAVYVNCLSCHSDNLGNIHDNNCSTCHVSPADTVIGTWTGACQQGGCHATYHADAPTVHWTVENQCTVCHGENYEYFPPLPTSCANCHATYNPADTVPPVTTSNAQPYYIVPISIDFTITDNGKVGVGTTYSRVDGGPLHIGSSIYVDTVGMHLLEFWSVDQAGNIESPPNTFMFEIAGDTEPPVTTSNALSIYYTPANITLTATDNSYLGPKTTYYILNTGPTQIGNSVYVPELNGDFSYTLQFWSDDWSGNEELPHNTVNFTIKGGTGTLRLVWNDSDTTGSPCTLDPTAEANWTIRRNNASGTIVTTGSGACPGWSGIEDVVVDVSPTPYFIRVDWWDSSQGFFEQTDFTNININTHGQVQRLSY